MGMVTGSGNTAIHQFFSYDSSGNVVSVDYSSNGGGTFTTYYYLRNAQNDIVKIIDGNGNTVVEYKYDSWGKLLSTTGSLAATLGTNQPFRYRGYVYDAETGWYYLQSRYYDPSIARFISADVYLSTGQGVLGHNAFSYCMNNPINYIDSTGKSASLTILGVTLTFVDVVILVVCVAVIMDLIINQEESLIVGLLESLLATYVSSVTEVQVIWDRLTGKPGEIKVEGNKKTHIGEDGRADSEQHNTDHGNPKHHTNPHHHDISWDVNGNPVFSSPKPGPFPWSFIFNVEV